MTEPRFFGSGEEFAEWLAQHHAREGELLVGFRKAHVKERGMTYAQALDAALCYGWIDGVRRSLGDDTWSIRFTPRRKGSIWSQVNIRRIRQLLEEGRVAPAGRVAFEAADAKKAAAYSYEQRARGFDAAHEAILKRHRGAWDGFYKFPPSYRSAASWWVMSAKRPDTRERRMHELMEYSARGARLDHLIPPAKRKPTAGSSEADPARKGAMPNAKRSAASAKANGPKAAAKSSRQASKPGAGKRGVEAERRTR